MLSHIIKPNAQGRPLREIIEKAGKAIQLINKKEQPKVSINITEKPDLDRIQERLNKYKYVYDWFQNECNRDYKNSFKTNVCGVPHQFGWGGLHGCPDEPLHIKGRIFHV